jgi:hypothetical protein
MMGREQRQTMWHTSCGNRTLHGAEARLFANALLCLWDEAVADPFEDYDLDLPCFDHLTYGQKISVVATRRETGAEEVPEPACPDPEVWDVQIQGLADRILWDADYEDEGLYLDRAPAEARELRRKMGIEDRYFETVAEDLTDRQAADRIAELQRRYHALVEEEDGKERGTSGGQPWF